MVSAIKVDGRRLHELAREGIEVERAAAAGDGPPFDVLGPTAIRRRQVLDDRRDLLGRAPTCARWPPTSAGCSAAAPTCAACAAPRSARSRSPRPLRPTRRRCCRPRRPCAASTRIVVDADDRRPRRQRAACSPRRPATGPWAFVDGAGGCSPSTSRSAVRPSPPSSSRLTPDPRRARRAGGQVRDAVRRPGVDSVGGRARDHRASTRHRGRASAPSSRSAPTTASTSATRR